MRGRHADAVAETVAREFVERGLHVDAVDLVHDQQHRAIALAQPGEDGVVERGRAFAAIHDEQHQVGFLSGGARLLRGGTGEAFLLPGDAAGIDQHERAFRIEPAHAVVAVARHAGRIMHERIAAAGQRVEQRRLADIGTTDEGDEREHGESGVAGEKTQRPRAGYPGPRRNAYSRVTGPGARH